jgi:hypothetical protein
MDLLPEYFPWAECVGASSPSSSASDPPNLRQRVRVVLIMTDFTAANVDAWLAGGIAAEMRELVDKVLPPGWLN